MRRRELPLSALRGVAVIFPGGLQELGLLLLKAFDVSVAVRKGATFAVKMRHRFGSHRNPTRDSQIRAGGWPHWRPGSAHLRCQGPLGRIVHLPCHP
jgi:hypothetical protein